MARRNPSLEFLLWLCREHRGLYILGAGASAGEVKLGREFLAAPGVDYALGDSFPVQVAEHDLLSRKIIDAAAHIPLTRVFPNRIIRTGTDFPHLERMQRMPNSFARLSIKNHLANGRLKPRVRDSYVAFRLFKPATIMNFNLDGFATDYCGDIHQVLTPHGTVPRQYGSPEMAQFVANSRAYDLMLDPDELVMSVPESSGDGNLWRCLDTMVACSPEFIVVIGYTFGRNGDGHDDWISLARFMSAFRDFAGDIYVIEPAPDQLREMIADGVGSSRVFGLQAYWNVLAHAFLESTRNRLNGRSLNYFCEQTLDRHRDCVVFPLKP